MSYLSKLLTDRALEVYSRLSRHDARNYELLKEASLRRYNLTENGYRSKFKEEKPTIDETPAKFVVRLRMYLDKLVELSKTEQLYDGLARLITMEQFMNACPKDLITFLRERAVKILEAIVEEADLRAHGRNLASRIRETGNKNPNYSGKEVEALCLQDAIYDLVIGNITSVKSPIDPDENWTSVAAVVMETKNVTNNMKQILRLKVNRVKNLDVTQERFKELQN